MKLLLFSLTAMVLAVVAATIMVGMRTFDGLVTENPYEKGLAWDRERRARASLGWQVEIQNARLTVGRNALDVSVRDGQGRDRTDALSGLMVSRPATVRFDRDYPVSTGVQGGQALDVEFPQRGLWDLTFLLRTDAGEHEVKKRVYVDQGAPSGDAERASAEGVNCIPRAGPCIQRVPTDDLQVRLEIDPPAVPTMVPLTFQLVLTQLQDPVTDAVVELSLSMPGMYMGPNRPALTHLGGGRYEGQGVLPRCSSGRRLWQAEVTVRRQGRAVAAAFLLEAE